MATMDGVVPAQCKTRRTRGGKQPHERCRNARIADMSKIEVRVDVGENDVPKVKLGDKAP